MSNGGDSPRISVSESTLRAALAEMELRLRVYFDEQLKHKAEQSDYVILASAVNALDRGDFTPVHNRALADFIDNHLSQQADRGWTARERRLGVVAILLTVLAIASSIFFGARAASAHASPAPQQQSTLTQESTP